MENKYCHSFLMCEIPQSQMTANLKSLGTTKPRVFKYKLRHIKNFDFISEKVSLNWTASHLADRNELQNL